MKEKPVKPADSNGNISQANELTEAAYYLSLAAKRVLWLCLWQSYKRKGQSLESNPLFTVNVADYQELFGVTKVRASADVKAGVEQLYEASVTFYPTDGETAFIKRRWLAEMGMRVGKGQWSVAFNERIIPFMHGLTTQFTTYSIHDCGKLNSTRAIRLYESLCQFRSTGIWCVRPDELATRFELPDSQRNNVAEMKRTFLNPSLKRITETTPLAVRLTQDPKGNFVFNIADKKPKKTPVE